MNIYLSVLGSCTDLAESRKTLKACVTKQSALKSCPPGLCRRWLALALTVGLLALQALPASAFDGRRAKGLISEQCDLGPRIPGTPAHKAGQEWIAGQLRQLGYTVWLQPFHVKLPLSGAEVEACNIWGLPAADGPTSSCVVLSAHWDTRPWADRDPSGEKVTMLGANDGASGVAMVLELARGLRQTSLKDHMVLAFWDAEDAGVNEESDSWCLGARYAATHRVRWMGRIRLGINLDMVGGEDLALNPETNSQKSAPWAVEELWQIGEAIGPQVFREDDPKTMIDDHLPWIRQGVPFIDLIGFPYRYWHTAGDTPEHCSAAAMEPVGNTLANYLLSEPWNKIRVTAAPGKQPAGEAKK